MEYQYKCQQYLSIRREKIILIPENCVIDKNLLCGLSNEVFVSTFRALQEIMQMIYDDAGKNPEKWGFPLEPYVKQEDEYCGYMNVKYTRIPEVIYFLFSEGMVKDGILHTDKLKFKDKIKNHSKINFVLNELTEFGFEITGFDKTDKEYTVSYPGNINIITVFQSYMQATAELVSKINPAYKVTVRAEYTGCLFYRFVEDKKLQNYDLIFHILTDTFTDEYRGMCIELYEQAKKEGHLYFPYYNFVYHSVDFENYLGLSFSFVTKEIFTNIKIRKLLAPDKIAKLYDLPDNLQENFKRSTCSRCGGIAAPGHGNTPSDYKKCKLRVVYDWHRQTIEGCAYHSFRFRNLHKDDLPCLIELYKMEFTEK